MRRIFGGLAAMSVLFLGWSSDARAQGGWSPGLYESYAPMTWGSSSAPMSYAYTARFPGLVAPYGYGPQNNAFTNTGLGAFVNGDNYAGPAPFTQANPNGPSGKAAAAPIRVRSLGRPVRRSARR